MNIFNSDKDDFEIWEMKFNAHLRLNELDKVLKVEPLMMNNFYGVQSIRLNNFQQVAAMIEKEMKFGGLISALSSSPWG